MDDKFRHLLYHILFVDNGCMTRITKTFTISLYPEMEAEITEIMKKEHRTRSELVREALRRYISMAELSKASSQDANML